jgi:hypothetical protein
MLPRTLNSWREAGILNFHFKYSYYAHYKELLKCRAVVRSGKNLLLRAVAGPRSCKKIRGTLISTPIDVFTKLCLIRRRNFLPWHPNLRRSDLTIKSDLITIIRLGWCRVLQVSVQGIYKRNLTIEGPHPAVCHSTAHRLRKSWLHRKVVSFTLRKKSPGYCHKWRQGNFIPNLNHSPQVIQT